MLFFSLLFILAGVSMVGVAGVMVAYYFISAGEKFSLTSPGNWPSDIKKWARWGGYGLGSTLLGMILTMIAT